MTPYEFVQLVLHAHGGTIRGKTKLQKTVYFVGVLTGELGNLGYHPHYFGPYSAAVAEAIDELRGLGFVDQSIATLGRVDSSGFELARQYICHNKDGASVAAEKAKRHSGRFKRIKEILQKHKKVFSQDYERLSIAAKTYFLLGEKKGKARLGELSALAAKFGWSVKVEQIKEGITKTLSPLGLVTLEE
jgi:uncharacterized protein YwgA